MNTKEKHLKLEVIKVEGLNNTYTVKGIKLYHHQNGWVLENAKVFLKGKRVYGSEEKSILSKVRL